ncbi:hypothetical protein GCM10023189_48150 [Nibrella saemangeumensis]|uniref:histidine kinase n=1 Tax=Nibrella saemangeumensis TaxID=1084526 RepID=A0ABP8NIA8_9BACT
MERSVMQLLLERENYRFYAASIATMAEFTLSLLILGYFLSLKGKTRDTWLMAAYIGLNMLVYLVDIGVTSSKPAVYMYFRVAHTILLSALTIFWTWCAYTYRGKPMYREAIGIILLETAGLVWLITYQSQNITNLSFTSPVFYPFILVIGFHAWTVVVLLRRSTNRFREQERIRENTPINQARSARSLQILALLFACWLSFVLGAIISVSPLIYHLGQMVLLLGILILHLNYAEEVTTFQVKLVSLPLATTLALLGILPFLLYGGFAPEYKEGVNDATVQYQLSVFAWLIPGATIFILVAFVLFYWIGLLRPLGMLLSTVRRIEAGEFDTQVPVLGQDELGYFARSLQRMAASLKVSYDELENRVAERTAELQSSLEQLQATQQQLIQKEKMASLGELTAGIAHEIQNPLNFVNNLSEVSTELVEELVEEAKAGHTEDVLEIAGDLKETLEKVNHHGKRADSIVKGMLQHSRAGSGEKQPTDLNALIDEYLRLAYQGLRAKDKNYNANLQLNFDPALGYVNIAPQEMGRVLLNLFNNAFYATQERQKQLGQADYQPHIEVTTHAGNGKVELKVKDNGTGIPKDIVEKIYQPFFTTKPTGQGTGLGLSLSYDIVTKGHGGELRVQTEEGQYTEFRVSLPTAGFSAF